MHTHMWIYIFMHLYHSETNNYIETKRAKTFIDKWVNRNENDRSPKLPRHQTEFCKTVSDKIHTA